MEKGESPNLNDMQGIDLKNCKGSGFLVVLILSMVVGSVTLLSFRGMITSAIRSWVTARIKGELEDVRTYVRQSIDCRSTLTPDQQLICESNGSVALKRRDASIFIEGALPATNFNGYLLKATCEKDGEAYKISVQQNLNENRPSFNPIGIDNPSGYSALFSVPIVCRETAGCLVPPLPSSFTTANFSYHVMDIIGGPGCDQKVYIGGQFTSRSDTSLVDRKYMAKISNNGLDDSAFSTTTGFSSNVNDLELANDSSSDVFVSGAFNDYKGVAVPGGLARIRANATLDTTFRVRDPSKAATLYPGINGKIHRVRSLKNGSNQLYVAGKFQSLVDPGPKPISMVARLERDGLVDTTFVSGLPQAVGDEVMAIDLDPTDAAGKRVYVGGTFYVSGSRLVRLLGTGAIDPTFTASSQVSASVFAVLAGTGGQSGKLYVGGQFPKHLVRLNQDGTLDTAFVMGTGFSSDVKAIMPAGDGTEDIYVASGGGTYNGSIIRSVVRIRPNGTLDPTFIPPASVAGVAFTVLPLPDGTVYVGGSSVWSSQHFVRLRRDGSVF